MKARRNHTFFRIIKMMVFGCFVFLNVGCGLDEVYSVDAPLASNIPLINVSGSSVIQSDYASRNFRFSTGNLSSSGLDPNACGTIVYYKIYSNAQTCVNEYSALNTLLNSSNSKNNSAYSLINTYKFQKLRYENSTEDPIIPGQNHDVNIRLTSYNNSVSASSIKYVVSADTTLISGYTEFSVNVITGNQTLNAGARIYFGTDNNNKFYVRETLSSPGTLKIYVSTALTSNYEIAANSEVTLIDEGIQLNAYFNVDGNYKGKPARYYNGRNMRFDFKLGTDNPGNDSLYAPVPRTTDFEDDVSTTTSVTNEHEWYITMYAVNYGYDATFTDYYSPICYLGTVAINDSSYLN